MVDLAEPSLRERKKTAAMRSIQTVAVDLFEQRGFDAVTIEEVAAAAEVSPSTVYRYFSTKEGLVLYDEWDDRLLTVVSQLFRDHDPITAILIGLETIGADHLQLPDNTKRRVALWFAVPSVRAAGYLYADAVTDSLAGLIADSPRHDLTRAQAQTLIGMVIGALLTASRAWIEDGGSDDFMARIRHDLSVIASLWQAHPLRQGATPSMP